MTNSGKFEKLISMTLSGKIAFLISSSFILSYAFLIFLTTCLLILKISISKFNLIAAVAFGLFYFLFYSIKILQLPTRMIFLSIILLVGLIIFAYELSNVVLDLSWDGQDYHYRAIKYLISGWNPIWHPKDVGNVWYNTIFNHYAKASWYSSAAIGVFSPIIETTKCMNVLMIFATFGVVYSTLSIFPNLRGGWSIFISLLASANPVSITQAENFYNDGQVASILTMFFCLFIMLRYFDDLIIRITFISCVILGISLKFTSAVYIVIFLFLFLLLLQLFPHFIFRVRKILLMLVVVSLTLSLIASYNPYISNLFQHGNPIYPFFSSSSINFMNGNVPNDFIGNNSISNLVKSLLSPSGNPLASGYSQIKNPFTFSRFEIEIFRDPDVRIGGFGPIFAASIILSIICIIFLLVLHRKNWKILIFPPLIIIISVMINPEGWWARYAPQLWLIPIYVVVCLLESSNKFAKIIAGLITTIIFLDVVLISIGYFTYNISESNRVKERIQQIQNSPQPITIFIGNFLASKDRLDYVGIKYIKVSSIDLLPCPIHLDPLTYYSPKSCPP